MAADAPGHGVMSRRAALVTAVLVLAVAVAIGAVRLATGADAGSAAVSAVGAAAIVGGGLGANQWAARRRARRAPTRR